MGSARLSDFFLRVRSTNVNVPSTRRSSVFKYYLTLVILLSSSYNFSYARQYHHLYLESSQKYDYFFDAASTESSSEGSGELIIGTQVEHYAEPTPPIDFDKIHAQHFVNEFSDSETETETTTNHNVEETEQITLSLYDDYHQGDTYISPAKVLKRDMFLSPASIIFSPIFNFQLLDDSNLLQTNYPIEKSYDNSNGFQFQQSSPTDGLTSNADFIETGSGNGWDNHMSFDDNSNIMEDSTSLVNEYDLPTTILPSPIATPTFSQATLISSDVKYNHAPVLNHRLPKLSITAGSVWRYFIPQDTFLDEDGDLKQLKSTVYFKKRQSVAEVTNSNFGNNMINLAESSDNTKETSNQYFSWVQYDQAALLLYGFSTDSNLGKHELIFEVSDRWGVSTYETLEINVKQHQSSSAFTHFFSLNNLSWPKQRFSSIVEALIEITKRLSLQVYLDGSIRNIVVRNYVVEKNAMLRNSSNQEENNLVSVGQYGQDQSIVSISLSWSNSSVPVHPCDISLVENLTKPLIDTQAIKDDWSILRGERVELTPSSLLMKYLRNDFKISSVGMGLQGSCETKKISQINEFRQGIEVLPGSTPKVRVKIGKLTWKLGELIEYKIPKEIFGFDNTTLSTRDLHLTLHTIDGKTLDKDIRYNYLEFDAENQTILGLSYDQTNHVGQRELQLTAMHPNQTLKVREVFIINIEPQDLTAINNRAFSMALYLRPRTVSFGPGERVILSHKIIEAISANYLLYDNMHEPDFIVIDIQKFNTKFYTSSTIGSTDGITRAVDHDNLSVDEFGSFRDSSSRKNSFYKFIWTNKTIGYHGDCPVEVIRENILYALEQSMLELKLPEEILNEDSNKNDTARFYDRLRLYFEPEIELFHMRFEPLSACLNALEPLDVGNSDIADQVDKVGDVPLDMYPEISTPYTISSAPKLEVEPDPDEYLSIVVLIILVMALIFVIIMFFMGMHTYKINQDKRFELQVRLAQARQNSMYLSSMMLANHGASNDIYNHVLSQAAPKSLFVVQEEEKCSRKPVILENEKRFLSNGQQYDLKSTAVQLDSQGIHTLPLKPNMSFTLDSGLGHWQPSSGILQPNQGTSKTAPIFQDEKLRSVTLDRRLSGSVQRYPPTNYAPMNHSQSILTVASLAGPMPLVPQGRIPVVPIYTHYPVIGEYIGQQQQSMEDFPSLKRRFSQQRLNASPMSINLSNQTIHHHLKETNNLFSETSSRMHTQNISENGVINNSSSTKIRSPSYSSSASMTTQSVISNPNYAPTSQAT